MEETIASESKVIKLYAPSQRCCIQRWSPLSEKQRLFPSLAVNGHWRARRYTHRRSRPSRSATSVTVNQRSNGSTPGVRSSGFGVSPLAASRVVSPKARALSSARSRAASSAVTSLTNAGSCARSARFGPLLRSSAYTTDRFAEVNSLTTRLGVGGGTAQKFRGSREGNRARTPLPPEHPEPSSVQAGP